MVLLMASTQKGKMMIPEILLAAFCFIVGYCVGYTQALEKANKLLEQAIGRDLERLAKALYPNGPFPR